VKLLRMLCDQCNPLIIFKGHTMHTLLVKLLALAALSISLTAGAQTPPPPPAYGPAITLEQAKKAMAAAEAEAVKNNWPVAIYIVDSGGHMVMMQRLPNTQIASLDIAQGKATSANNFRRPTKALEDAVAGGGAGLRLLALKNVTPLEGGELIMQDGKIIGAIGVSGVASGQDAQVARAGAAAAIR
jgi:glc operon protein GlcG